MYNCILFYGVCDLFWFFLVLYLENVGREEESDWLYFLFCLYIFWFLRILKVFESDRKYKEYLVKFLVFK